MTRRLTPLVAAIGLSAALLGGCQSTPPDGGVTSGAGSAAGVSVTDQAGRTVTLDAPATKVVALTASDVEILYAIGAGADVVGRGEYADYPAEAESVAVVNSGSETNIEQIIALQPDLVIVGTMAQDPEQADQLAAAGIAVAVTDAQTIAETYDTIRLIGALTGRADAAAAVIDDMQATFADLAARAQAVAPTPHKTIYYEVSPLEYGLWAAGSGSFMDEVGHLLQLDNVFADLSSWAEVDQEQVIQRNPDYILTVGMYFGDGPTPIESILGRAGWESVTAVKNRAILNLTGDELSRPGPRLADGAQKLYDFVYADGPAEPTR
ncbi:MAG: helical backbone metal receptor [Propionibacteriaceae bacterium]|jgi:iron complex transport system substrate-binding protein|nr:helical backbone metal receptor [Propionibacteriaceae bacterium]